MGRALVSQSTNPLIQQSINPSMRLRAAKNQKEDFEGSPGYQQATQLGFRVQTPAANLSSRS